MNGRPVNSGGRLSPADRLAYPSWEGPVDSEAVLERFNDLSIWKQGDQRAPHKPLLVLYALGRWQRGDTGDLPFDQLAPDVAGLLREFGPPRRCYHPEYPFWWLQ